MTQALLYGCPVPKKRKKKESWLNQELWERQLGFNDKVLTFMRLTLISFVLLGALVIISLIK